MIRLSQKLQELDKRVQQHKLKYKCVPLSKKLIVPTVQQIKQQDRERAFESTRPRPASLSQLPSKHRLMSHRLSRGESFRSRQSQRRASVLQLTQNSLNNMLKYARIIKEPSELVCHQQFKKCSHLMQLTKDQYGKREQHLRRIIQQESEKLKKQRVCVYPREIPQPKHLEQSKQFQKSTLSKLIKPIPSHYLTVEDGSKLPLWFAKVTCSQNSKEGPVVYEAFAPNHFDWTFQGTREVFFISLQSLQFVRIKNIICRGTRLYKYQMHKLSQIVDLLNCYKQINHVLFFQRNAAVSPLMYCAVCDQNNLEYQAIFYEGTPNVSEIQPKVNWFFQLLFKATIGRTKMNFKKEPQVFEIQTFQHKDLKRAILKKKVLLRNIKGQYFTIELNKICI